MREERGRSRPTRAWRHAREKGYAENERSVQRVGSTRELGVVPRVPRSWRSCLVTWVPQAAFSYVSRREQTYINRTTSTKLQKVGNAHVWVVNGLRVIAASAYLRRGARQG